MTAIRAVAWAFFFATVAFAVWCFMTDRTFLGICNTVNSMVWAVNLWLAGAFDDR